MDINSLNSNLDIALQTPDDVTFNELDRFIQKAEELIPKAPKKIATIVNGKLETLSKHIKPPESVQDIPERLAKLKSTIEGTASTSQGNSSQSLSEVGDKAISLFSKTNPAIGAGLTALWWPIKKTMEGGGWITDLISGSVMDWIKGSISSTLEDPKSGFISKYFAKKANAWFFQEGEPSTEGEEGSGSATVEPPKREIKAAAASAQPKPSQKKKSQQQQASSSANNNTTPAIKKDITPNREIVQSSLMEQGVQYIAHKESTNGENVWNPKDGETASWGIYQFQGPHFNNFIQHLSQTNSALANEILVFYNTNNGKSSENIKSKARELSDQCRKQQLQYMIDHIVPVTLSEIKKFLPLPLQNRMSERTKLLLLNLCHQLPWKERVAAIKEASLMYTSESTFQKTLVDNGYKHAKNNPSALQGRMNDLYKMTITPYKPRNTEVTPQGTWFREKTKVIDERCHPDLIKVYKEWIKIIGKKGYKLGINFNILQVGRSPKEHKHNLKKGTSKAKYSKHMAGMCIDISPIGQEASPKITKEMIELGKAWKEAGKNLGIPVISGAVDWGWDGFHLELAEKIDVAKIPKWVNQELGYA